MKLKVLSWNIWFHANLAKVNKFLENSNADILGLQEVMMVDNKLQLSKRLLEELGYQFIYAPAFQFPINGIPTNIGNAIFSRYPITTKKFHNLSEVENRLAVQADVKVGERTLHVFCTHLYHTHQQPSNLQDLQVTNLAKVLPAENTVLMGDFNALPESKPIKLISDVLNNTDPNLLSTWSVYPEGCKKCLPKGIMYKLDNIFISRDLRSLSYQVEESKASDHLPISAIIEC